MNIGKEQALGVLRHVLTLGGGYAAGRGFLDEATATEIIGGVVALAGVLWSVFAPEKIEAKKARKNA